MSWVVLSRIVSDRRQRCALGALALAVNFCAASQAQDALKQAAGEPVAVYSVDALGATPNVASDDDTPGIQAAIDAAIDFANVSGRTAVVHFTGGGEYRLRTGKRGRGHLDLSCADGHGQVILRGNGARLVVELPRLGLFFAERSKSVAVEDFEIDLAVRPHVGCTVASVDAEQRMVVAEPLPGATPLADFPGYSQEWGWIHDSAVLHRPKAGAASSFEAASRTQASPDGPIRFTMSPAVRMGDFAVGDVLSYHYRRGNNFRLQDCEDMQLSGIKSYGAGLFFVSTSHVSGLTVRDSAVLVKPGQVQATNGDGIHLKYCRSVELSDCLFEGLSDDGINVTGTWGFEIQRCAFLDKRRHAIALDTDVAQYRSRAGRIVDCVAAGNGGSFLHHDGGDYSSIEIRGNRTLGNNRTRSSAQVDRHQRLGLAGTERVLAWSESGALSSGSGPADGSNDQWSIIRMPTERGPRCRVQAQLQGGPQPWLFLSGSDRPVVTRSVRVAPREDPKHRRVDTQVWVQVFLPDGTFCLQHELTGRYLGLASLEGSRLTMTPDVASAQAWTLIAPD